MIIVDNGEDNWKKVAHKNNEKHKQKYKVLLISNRFKIGDSIFKSIKKKYKNSLISEKNIFFTNKNV